MFRGLLLLAIKEGWGEEEVDKRIKQFAVATAMNDYKALDDKSTMAIARSIAVQTRRNRMKVVGGTEKSPTHDD